MREEEVRLENSRPVRVLDRVGFAEFDAAFEVEGVGLRFRQRLALE